MKAFIDFLYYFLCFISGYTIGAHASSFMLGLITVVAAVFVLHTARLYVLEKLDV